MSRLIYADALIEDLKKYFIENKIHKNDLTEAIAKQPIVDAVPVVHGEWEYQWFDSVCSNCGYINKADSVTRIRDDHNFCPNCGADMRGEKND